MGCWPVPYWEAVLGPQGAGLQVVGDEGCCATATQHSALLPFAGMEDEQCPDHRMLLCSLPASPSWHQSEGELITLLDCQRNSWSCGKGPRGIVGSGPGQSWFISVLRSRFPASLEISSRSPSGAWSPWKDLHLAAGVREGGDLALHGSKFVLGVKLEQILGHS